MHIKTERGRGHGVTTWKYESIRCLRRSFWKISHVRYLKRSRSPRISSARIFGLSQNNNNQNQFGHHCCFGRGVSLLPFALIVSTYARWLVLIWEHTARERNVSFKLRTTNRADYRLTPFESIPVLNEVLTTSTCSHPLRKSGLNTSTPKPWFVDRTQIPNQLLCG